jgi:ABC-type uncharacterized transport system permease subunit
VLHPTAMQFAGFAALCVAGIAGPLLADVHARPRSASGRCGAGDRLWGYYNLFNIARMPDEAFKGAFKAVFTFALPMLLVSNVPVRVLADKLRRRVWLLLMGLGVVWAAISEWFWRKSLRRYTSAST